MLKNEIKLKPLLHYQWCGKFTAESERWKHMSRPLGEEELFLVTEGRLYIADEEGEYEVGAGEYLVMSPCRFQHGYRSSKCSFYWLHFIDTEGSKREKRTCTVKGESGSQPYVFESVSTWEKHGYKNENQSIPSLPRTGQVRQQERIIILLNQLIESSRRYHQQYLSDLLCTGVLLELWSQRQELENTALSPAVRLYQGVLDYVEWNFQQDITVRQIADYFGYHEKYLSTVFHKWSGMSLKSYILKEKMEHARAGLIDTDKSVRQIAEEVGYSDSHNFSNAFRKVTGMSPSQYRMSCRKAPKTP